MKTNKFICIILSLFFTVSGLVLPISAATTLTKEHYPTGVVVNDSKLYWAAPEASGLTKTKLYKRTNGAWGEGTEVSSPAVLDDETAVYKLEFVYNGFSSEYVIQKNDGAKGVYGLPFGGSWGTEPSYVGITADDRAAGNHSLLIHNYVAGDNRRWVEFASNGTLIPNDLETTGKRYQLDFDYKTSTGFKLWFNGKEFFKGVSDGWQHYTNTANWNDTKNQKTEELSFDASWYLDVRVDNLTIYELDANGNKTGANLIAFDGTFESSGSTYAEVENPQYYEDNGVITFEWTKPTDSLATRIYSSDGILAAEVESTSAPITLPTAGNNTYVIKSVYKGGYESGGVTVKVKTLAEIAEYISEITELIADCRANSISTDYEDAALAIITRFYEQMMGGNTENWSNILTSLTDIYKQTVSDLRKYLDGKKKSLSSPKYKTGKLEIQNGSFLGTVTEDNTDYTRPVFLNGVGHWDYVRNDVEFFEKIGFNHIQTELEMGDVLAEPSPVKDWVIKRMRQDSTTATQASDERNSGSCSLKLADSDTTWTLNKLTMIKQTVKVKQKTTYEYSFYIKGAKPSVMWFSLHGRVRQDGSWRMLSNEAIWGDGQWHKVSGTYKTAAGETELTLAFINEGGAEGVYIDDIRFARKLDGINIVKNPSFEETSANEVDVDYDTIDDVCDFLQNAEEHNVSVDLLLSVHDTPSFFATKYPELDYNGYGFFGEGNFDPTLEKSRELIKIYVDAICEKVKDYTSLSSVCISNEPSYIANYAANVHTERWHSWLKERYNNDIAALNKAYGTSFGNFEDCALTENIGKYYDYNAYWNTNAKYKDYQDFSNEIFAEWHSWIAGVVKNHIPNVFVHSKVMPSVGPTDHRISDATTYPRQQIYNSADSEMFAEFTDLNGYDKEGVFTDNYNYETLDFINDYLQAAEKAPNANSENHIVAGQTSEDAQVAYAFLWQGALHGLGQSAAWIWDNDYELAKSSNHYDAMLNLKPEHIWKMSKMSLDFNRLAYEVNAVKNADARVGVLFSKTARAFSLKHMSATFAAYRSCEYAGEKVRFITDTNPSLEGLELVIIPEAECVPDSLITELNNSNVKVIKIGATSLTKNERGLSRTGGLAYNGTPTKTFTAKYNYDNTITSPTDSSIITAIKSALEPKTVELTTKSGGVPEGIAWSVAEYNQKTLVSICNYTADPIELKLSGNASWTDRITEESVNASSITVYPHTPLLLEEQKTVSLAQKDGAASDTVSAGGNYTVVADNGQTTTSDIFAAFYKDGVLVKNVEKVQDKDELTIPDGNIADELKIFVWENMKPITEAVKYGIKTKG